MKASYLSALSSSELHDVLLNHFVIGAALELDANSSGNYPVANSKFENVYNRSTPLNQIQIDIDAGRMQVKHPTEKWASVDPTKMYTAFVGVIDIADVNTKAATQRFVENREIHLIDTIITDGFFSEAMADKPNNCSFKDSVAIKAIIADIGVGMSGVFVSNPSQDAKVKLTDSRITQINLSSTYDPAGNVKPHGINLSGTLSASVGDLDELTSLVLSDNHLSGPLPNELKNCKKLYNLNLDNNMFTVGQMMDIQTNFGLPFSYMSNKSGHVINYSKTGSKIQAAVDDRVGTGTYLWELTTLTHKVIKKTTDQPNVEFDQSEFLKGSLSCTIQYETQNISLVAELPEIYSLDIDTIKTTVHWSGIKTHDHLTVIANGGHLIMDEGLELTFLPQCNIKMVGTGILTVNGSEKKRVQLKGSDQTKEVSIYSEEGSLCMLDANFCDIHQGIGLDLAGKSRNVNPEIHINNCTFSEAAIKLTKTRATFLNTTFRNSKQPCISTKETYLGIDACTFSNSMGLSLFDTEMMLTNSTMQNMMEGDLIYQKYGELRIDSCDISDNYLGEGHVISMEDVNSLTVNHSSFTNNIAIAYEWYKDGVIISGNSEYGRPGRNIEVNIENTTFKRNGALLADSNESLATIVYIPNAIVGDFIFRQNKVLLSINANGIIAHVDNYTICYVINNTLIGNMDAFSVVGGKYGIMQGNIFASNGKTFSYSTSYEYILNNVFEKGGWELSHEIPVSVDPFWYNNISTVPVKKENYEYDYSKIAYNCIPSEVGKSNVNVKVQFKSPVRFNVNLLQMDQINDQLLDSLEAIISKADYTVVNGPMLIDGGKLPPLTGDKYNYWDRYMSLLGGQKDVYGTWRLSGKSIDIGAAESTHTNPSKLLKNKLDVDTVLHNKYILVHSNQPEKFAVDLGVDKCMYKDSTAVLSPQLLVGGVNPFQYLWNNESASGPVKSFNTKDTKDYILNITDANGCTASDTVQVYLIGLNVGNVPGDKQLVDISAFDANTQMATITTTKPIQSVTSLRVYDVNGRVLEVIPVAAFESKQSVKITNVGNTGVFILAYSNPYQKVSKKVVILK